MNARPVVVVGDVGVDVITCPAGEIHWHSDTPSAVSFVPGGAGGNTASWLAAAGASVSLVASVGDDRIGELARQGLEADGVHCAFAVDADLPTGAVVVLVDAHAERTMFPDRGANQGLSVGDIDLAAVRRAMRADGHAADPDAADGPAHLHLSGYVLLDGGSRAAGLEALRQARQLGWTTSVDPQATSLLQREGVDAFLSWVDGIDLLLPNEDEIAELGGIERALQHTRAVVPTYGAAGARWVGPGVDERVDPPHVDRVDTTGCGDAFNAGLLVAWVAGAPPPDALRAGVQTGSRAAATIGARPG